MRTRTFIDRLGRRITLIDDGYRIRFTVAYTDKTPVEHIDPNEEFLWAEYKHCNMPGPAESIANLLMEGPPIVSLLHAPGPPPEGCNCRPGWCSAPRIMGFQTPCRDPKKAALRPEWLMMGQW